MVKKIIMVEEQQAEITAVVPQSEFQDTVIAKLDAIDWKFWEILKIAQRWEETTLGRPPPPLISELTPHEVDVGMVSIIVNEDGDSD